MLRAFPHKLQREADYISATSGEHLALPHPVEGLLTGNYRHSFLSYRADEFRGLQCQ